MAKTRADNGWRCSNDLIPTAVAGFISIWALQVHKRSAVAVDLWVYSDRLLVVTGTFVTATKGTWCSLKRGRVQHPFHLRTLTSAGWRKGHRSIPVRFHVQLLIPSVFAPNGGLIWSPSFWAHSQRSKTTVPGRFPIPKGLRYLLDSSKLKAEFLDLSWDALRVLHEHRAEISACWCEMLTDRGLNDRVLYNDVPERVQVREVGLAPLHESANVGLQLA